MPPFLFLLRAVVLSSSHRLPPPPGVLTASEEDIRAALRLVWERMKCVIEPSAAVGLAVALKPEFREVSVGVIISVIVSVSVSVLTARLVYDACDLRLFTLYWCVQKYGTSLNVGIILCGGEHMILLHTHQWAAVDWCCCE